MWGLGWALFKPNVPGPFRDEGMASEKPVNKGEILEGEPHGQEESLQDQPLFKPNPEEVAEIVISEGDESDFPIEVPEAASTPRSKRAQCWKRSSEDQDPHPSPPKKRATKEEEESILLQEAALPRGVKMEDILPRRYETLAADLNWVHQVRCSLLELEAGTTPSKEDINTSERFVP